MPAVKCKCRGCGDVGTLEINPDEVAPYIFWCPRCKDFMLADPIKRRRRSKRSKPRVKIRRRVRLRGILKGY